MNSTQAVKTQKQLEARKGELQSIPVGFTKNVNGHVVTRWSESTFEVDTWGKQTLPSVFAAVNAVFEEVAPVSGGPVLCADDVIRASA